MDFRSVKLDRLQVIGSWARIMLIARCWRVSVAIAIGSLDRRRFVQAASIARSLWLKCSK